MYRVVLYPTKSMTLALTDIGSLQKFSKWNRTPKGSSNFNNVGVYLFVNTCVHSLVVPNQKYDPHINRHRFPKIFKNGTERRKACRILVMWESIFSLIRVYMVLSYPTKSMTLALTDIGFLQKFSKWNRTPKGSSNLNNVGVYLFVNTCVESYRIQPKVRASH